MTTTTTNKLQLWLDKRKKTRVWFGQQFQPSPAATSTVDGWCAEVPKMPQKRYRDEIVRITGGKVTMKDFV